MKNNIIKSLIYSFIVFGLINCDGDFEEVNENPNDPATAPSGLLMADPIFLATNQLYSNFVGGDMGSCWAQQWSKVQYNDEERYIPRTAVIQAVWDVLYEDLASDAKKIYEIAQTEENTNMQGVAKIMQAYAFSVLTDIYGDIPVTEALQAENGLSQPVYDEQSVVYDTIISYLDAADLLLASGTGDIGTSDGTSDLIYGGDATLWRKFANSLKFRVLMRMSDMEDVSADLQALVNSEMLFSSNDDEAKLIYLDNDPSANPIYENIVFGARGEFKVSDLLVDMLTTNGDPRLTVYVGTSDEGELRGKPAGMSDVPNAEYNYQNVSPIGDAYLEPTAPGFWMSYAQLNFLLAEATIKGYITGNTAQSYFQAGINASLTDVNNNLASGAYTETLSTDTNTALQQIAEQEWLALFCQGVEAWIEQRRTGYPVLTPAIDGVLDEIPSRYTYPSGEQSLNAANYTAAVESQGIDLLTTKMWWDN